MKYTETTESYNASRYGKPWMALVSTSLTKDFSFIDWDGRPGGSGEFFFDAEPGTILAYGQKDLRKGRGGVDGYQICMPDGKLPGCQAEDARVINKLPIGKRCEAFARIKVAAAEDSFRPYQYDTPEEKARQLAAHEAYVAAERAKWAVYLPSELSEEDYLCGAA